MRVVHLVGTRPQFIKLAAMYRHLPGEIYHTGQHWGEMSDPFFTEFSLPKPLPLSSLGGGDIAKTVVEFARSNHVTQIFVAHSEMGVLERLRGRNFAEDIVRSAQDLQVTVVADRSRRQVS